MTIYKFCFVEIVTRKRPKNSKSFKFLFNPIIICTTVTNEDFLTVKKIGDFKINLPCSIPSLTILINVWQKWILQLMIDYVSAA